MKKAVDPKSFGLHPKTHIEQTGSNRYVIIIRRKSRIVMKDGKNLLTKIAQIKSHIPDSTIDVQTTAPVCSKTKALLIEHGVTIDTLPC